MMVWWLCGLRLKLVAVRSAVEICPRVLILEGLDHTGVVAPGVVAPIDQTALMKALLVLALQKTQTPKIIRE